VPIERTPKANACAEVCHFGESKTGSATVTRK
jgi:hypothetical protein